MASNLICMGSGVMGTNGGGNDGYVYAVPPGKTAVITEILVCNNNETRPISFRVAILPPEGGYALGDNGNLLVNCEVLEQETRFITLATVMRPGERLLIQYGALNMGVGERKPTFRVSGLEVDDV